MDRGGRRGSTRRILAWAAVLALGFLGAEAALPAHSQPGARLAVAAIHGYQAVGSPAVRACGLQCRYTPTCSHYAADAFDAYGTLGGGWRALGRLWRCSPWGGSGYDPAVAEISGAPAQADAQETPEQKRAREQFKKDMEELQKGLKDLGPEARDAAIGCGLGLVGCVVVTVGGLIISILIMVWVYKDARARGDQNAVLWLVLIFFLNWVGLIVYFVARPKGNLVPCPNCRNARLETLVKCPLCGADTGAAKSG
jgi:putative membrane protein insertion efficiency factor